MDIASATRIVSDSPVKVGTLLADRIIAQGARTVFALGGAPHTPLLMALEDRQVNIVSTRHESGTVGAADGYARVTGRIGFALIIAEQGLPNALSAIRTAQELGSPVVVLTTRFPDRWMEPDETLSVDHHEMVAPTTKFRRTVPSIARIGEFFDAACKAASEGRPGVAVLLIPSNFMGADVLPSEPMPRPKAARPLAHPDAVKEAVDRLMRAERPMIIADSAAAFAGAGPALRRLAEDCRIPVLGMGRGRGLVPEEAPLGYPWPYGQRAASRADCVLVVGARLDMRFGYGLPPRFAEAATFIHLSEQEADMGRNTPVDVPVIGGLAQATEQITDALVRRSWRSDPQWIVNALADREARVDELVGLRQGPLHQLHLAVELDAKLPRRRLIAGDGADLLNYCYARLRLYEDGVYADHNPFGSMGMGLPLALGMAAAEAELGSNRPTVLVTGDGSLGFYIAELDSIRRAGLKVIVVVSNDGIWGPEYSGQMLVHNRSVNTLLEGCDYSLVGKGFGLDGEQVETIGGLSDALDRALKSDRAYVIDAKIGRQGGSQRKSDPLLSIVMFDDIEKKQAP